MAERATTPEGWKGYQILDWAFEDPAQRAPSAVARISELARGIEDPVALRELGDVSTMARRLAGSRRNIASQVPA